MTKPIILADIDGCFANFIGAGLKIIKQKWDRDHHHDDVTQMMMEASLGLTPEETVEFYKEVAKPGHCFENIEPYDGAAECIAELQTMGEVIAVTMQFGSPTWTHERENWLVEHLNIPTTNVIHSPSKLKELIYGHVFIEDKTSTLVAWGRRWPKSWGIRVARKYNEHEMYSGTTVSNYEQLIGAVRVALDQQRRLEL